MAAMVRSLVTLVIGFGVAQAAAQSPVDCQQILSGTAPFQLDFSDGTISQISRQSDGHTVVLNGRKGSREAFSRQLLRSGYLVRLETKDSTITLNHDVDFLQNPYAEKRSFVGRATRTETKDGVTRPIPALNADYQFVGSDQKIVGACLVKTVVFAATMPGRCGDKPMPPVIHHLSVELRTAISSSGHYCRNGEYVSFDREAEAVQTSITPLALQGR
ncbi:hypothetical protein LJR090_003904 [Bosea sp. LjRoot90]